MGLAVYPDLKRYRTLQAHPSNCISIEFDPTGNWPVRALSFSFDGKILASASEDLFIDIALVDTSESVYELNCPGPTFTLAWHPSKYVLAYSCGDR
ncbi:hypothetical protein MXB_3458, partial [Myxobolus squamalis]